MGWDGRISHERQRQRQRPDRFGIAYISALKVYGIYWGALRRLIH
jgi:hypothetical protein